MSNCNLKASVPPTAQEVLDSPATSYWLKNALRSALERDPVDAASDAELMAQILVARADALLAGEGVNN